MLLEITPSLLGLQGQHMKGKKLNKLFVVIFLIFIFFFNGDKHMAQIGDIRTVEETVSTPDGPKTVTKTFQVQSTPAGPKEVDITSRYADTSGIREGSDFGKFANFTFPARRDGSESNQASLLDFSKMTPLREESTEGNAAAGEEDFNPQKYRVGQINRTEDGTASAMIYDYTTNATVGTYVVGQPVPAFGNRKVQSIDPDAKTVTLDDGSVISFTLRTAIRDRKDQLNRKASTFSGLTDEQREDLVTRLDTPAARENNAVAVQMPDGRVAIVYQGPDRSLSWREAQQFAARNNGRLPNSAEATAIIQNADKQVAYFLPDGNTVGVPSQGVDTYRAAASAAYSTKPGEYGAGMYKIYTDDNGIAGFIGLCKDNSCSSFYQGEPGRATTLGQSDSPHGLDYGSSGYVEDRTHRVFVIKDIIG